jgi:hypothetical protein
MIGPTNDGFKMVAGEGARLKREQLHREIGQVQDETLRANLEHTYGKLFMFLEEDIRRALREAGRAP